MDAHPAELLPGLYREVLDAVAALEQLALRVEAGHVREAATLAYSRAWDEAAARRLRRLRDDARRLAGTPHRPRTVRPWHALRRRPAQGRPV